MMWLAAQSERCSCHRQPRIVGGLVPGANAAFGWWWADPVAAIAMTYFLVTEGREAWRGEDCCDGECHG
jgi:hypothetical protein